MLPVSGVTPSFGDGALADLLSLDLQISGDSVFTEQSVSTRRRHPRGARLFALP